MTSRNFPIYLAHSSNVKRSDPTGLLVLASRNGVALGAFAGSDSAEAVAIHSPASVLPAGAIEPPVAPRRLSFRGLVGGLVRGKSPSADIAVQADLWAQRHSPNG